MTIDRGKLDRGFPFFDIWLMTPQLFSSNLVTSRQVSGTLEISGEILTVKKCMRPCCNHE